MENKKLMRKIESINKQITTKQEQLDCMQTNTYRRQKFASNKAIDIDKLNHLKAVLENNKDNQYIDALLNTSVYECLKNSDKYPTLRPDIDENYWYYNYYHKLIVLLTKFGITENNFKELQEIVNTDYSYLNREEIKKREIRMKKDKLLLSNIKGYYPTPKSVLELIEEKLREECSDDFISNAIMLEPSAGSGNIAEFFKDKVKHINCVEYNYNLSALLKEQDFNVIGDNIFDIKEGSYDIIIMNPPFENKQDIEHVLYCYNNLLKNNGGVLIAIMSASALQLESNKEFKEFVRINQIIQPTILQGAFKESNTGVSVGIIGLIK